MQKSAILGFGRYLPRNRIRIRDIAEQWSQEGLVMEKTLGIAEKTVPGHGEDTFTMAFEAATQAINISTLASSEISACFVGSESHPYAVKPTSGMLVSALTLHPFSHAADLEFACKAGTAGMQIVDSFIRSGQIEAGLAIGSDTAQARPGDALEYTAAAGAAAFVMGSAKSKHAIASMDRTLSFTTDTPDFWRANGEEYPSHAGRFTGEPGYFHHVKTALEAILETAHVSVSDIDHVILHMPNVKFPQQVLKSFGFKKEQWEHGFIVPTIGNTYSACSPLGLTYVLEQAKRNQTILLVSYGSGSGADAFLLTMLKDGKPLPVDEREKQYISYADYAVSE